MISLTVNDTLNSTVTAIVDTGANCSCINTDFRNRYFPNTPIEKSRGCSVKQASGSSVGAIGTIAMVCNIKGKAFRHEFIVCSDLKETMILGLDFAQSYKIGIDWDANMDPYLRWNGKYLTSAMPLKSLHPEASVRVLRAASPGTTNQKGKYQTMKGSPVSCKAKPMVRLLSRTQVRLPPKSLSVIPVNLKAPDGSKKIRTLDITGYDSLYVEHPDISILPTTHTKINKNKAGYLVILVYNSGEEEVVINKSNTLALGTKSQWKIRSSNHRKGRIHTKPIRQVYRLDTGSALEVPSAREALEKTAFVGRHNTYTKPKVDLRDIVVPPNLQKKFENLKEKYVDIFSVGPSDIGLTNLAEMTIDTKADAIPYAARPYKLALQHQEFLRREIQALLDMGIIVPSVSQYAAPCMVVPRKCKNSPVRAEVV